LFSKDQRAFARLLKLLSAGFFFPQGKIFQTVNNFSCYIVPLRFKTEGLHPKFFSKREHDDHTRFLDAHVCTKINRCHRRLPDEQFFRQCERNKPEELEQYDVSDFKITLS